MVNVCGNFGIPWPQGFDDICALEHYTECAEQDCTYYCACSTMQISQPGTMPVACYTCLSSSKHPAVRMWTGRLDLIKLKKTVTDDRKSTIPCLESCALLSCFESCALLSCFE